ncbi:MAG: DegT/DnrJ/EryC1/StrS family aminotransferase [Desulfobacterota bacterium]|nr:DegT/DnrJ/EryC1/StrS family aminotransferase [Thermodesulfobacteriota bacterium]
MHVPLLDLRLQYERFKGTLLPRMHEFLAQQQFILGPQVEALEHAIAEYCGVPFAIGVTSGTDALLLSLMALGVGPGDKVITTPYTFFATVGAIARLGATPVFVDIEPDTYTIDAVQLALLLDAYTPKERIKIKAIIPVHLYGQCADMKPILACSRQYNIPVIEDAAQALGAGYVMDDKLRKACSFGEFGCLSFFPSKNLGCFGDGGMITTPDADMAQKLRCLRVHGQTEGYYHNFIGINGRLDALQALILQVKLPYLEEWTERRRNNAAQYTYLFDQEGLTEFITPPRERTGSFHVYNQYVVRARDRDKLKQYLLERGIGTAVYYPLPLHLQYCFKYLGYKAGDFPHSECAARETLALPVFPELTQKQIEYVVDTIRRFYKKNKIFF